VRKKSKQRGRKGNLKNRPLWVVLTAHFKKKKKEEEEEEAEEEGDDDDDDDDDAAAAHRKEEFRPTQTRREADDRPWLWPSAVIHSPPEVEPLIAQISELPWPASPPTSASMSGSIPTA
jgi:ABC-type Zn2+ transport system substrate-binding protein/surface adhesin